MSKRAWVVTAAAVLAVGAAFAAGWLVRQPPAAIGPSQSPAAAATISGTLTWRAIADGNPLTGDVSVMSIYQTGPVIFTVTVAPDGTWSATVTPGKYMVLGRSSDFADGRTLCQPVHNPIQVDAGGSVRVEVLCGLPG